MRWGGRVRSRNGAFGVFIGLGLVGIGILANNWGFFEPASLENLAKYHADVILVDSRSSDKLEALKDQPIWQNLPAGEAGQQYLWYPAAPYSYKSYAPLVRGYATHIEGARSARRS
ncbi:ABC transporter substrate-binding protein [Lolliginicoccus levis]|uniref:ABC transporter substrate-binding protein n=1 Tax=Lolliginicoccus levis TaxID=2919542 RepID=UPI00241D6F95|nr:ABC transporter substrate-binding protein [Lolliginicoccus levis]